MGRIAFQRILVSKAWIIIFIPEILSKLKSEDWPIILHFSSGFYFTSTPEWLMGFPLAVNFLGVILFCQFLWSLSIVNCRKWRKWLKKVTLGSDPRVIWPPFFFWFELFRQLNFRLGKNVIPIGLPMTVLPFSIFYFCFQSFKNWKK